MSSIRMLKFFHRSYAYPKLKICRYLIIFAALCMSLNLDEAWVLDLALSLIMLHDFRQAIHCFSVSAFSPIKGLD